MKIGVRMSIAAALFILGATFVLRQLVQDGILDGSLGTRVAMVANGVIVALTGNLIPKTLTPPRRTAEAERRNQAALRSSGWAMTLAGLNYIAVWLAAPTDIAIPVSLGVLALAVIYMFYRTARCKWGSEDAAA